MKEAHSEGSDGPITVPGWVGVSTWRSAGTKSKNGRLVMGDRVTSTIESWSGEGNRTVRTISGTEYILKGDVYFPGDEKTPTYPAGTPVDWESQGIKPKSG